ncbi:MAG: acyltransferase family protein [Myxococcales bacterium]|nr:acyltransferase family protein [Myxococcales bacterium]
MAVSLSGAILRAAWDTRLDDELVGRIDQIHARYAGRDGDPFGFEPQDLRYVAPVIQALYRRYFRVQASGLEHLPEGRVLLIANHSGQVPIDATMIGAACLLEADPPRVPRAMVERWVPTLPVVSSFFARMGQVLGTPANCRRMLRDEEAVLVFPEGVRGINKPYAKRYQLQQFGHGFMRLALENDTPIVPVGVVGAEEQYPVLWNLEGVAKRIGMPALPISPLMVAGPLAAIPLPTKYRIYFGHPLRFHGDPDDDERVIGGYVGQVRDAIDSLLQRGLAERRGWFA